MVFSSFIFLCYFLPLFFFIYFISPRKNIVILVASLLFYGWGEPLYILILLVYIVLNYLAGLALAQARFNPRLVLWLGIGANLAMLFYFKYFVFVAGQARALLGALGLPDFSVPSIALPLGISFFTFQGISYLIDIHRADIAPQRSLLKFAMYKAMFPQLVAGPIVRYRQIRGKIDEGRRVSLFRLRHGILVFLLGLAQKVLIANTVAGPAQQIFALPGEHLAADTAWLGAICYTLQIYFDFNGYSNMAIGLGHMMGFTLPPNFRRPYVAQSITEFWRRWHISLSTWFRDYVYIPLGGNRCGTPRLFGNLLSVFFLCGLWHGASWTFVVWGLYHGAFLIAERVMAKLPAPRPWRPLRHLYALLVVVVGWVIFRCDSLPHAAVYLRAMLGTAMDRAASAPGAVSLADIGTYLSPSIMMALVAGVVFSALPAVSGRRLARVLRNALGLEGGGGRFVAGTFGVVAGCGALALLVLSMVSLAAGTYNPFIYFRF